jgi:glycosyltransferase involved in cell wall biosynthesis
MKIGYLCPDLGISPTGYKGASSHIKGFTCALKDLGHSVDILSPNGGDVVIPPPALLQGLCKDVDKRLYRALNHLFFNSAIESSLTDYIKQEKPDIIYERYSPFSFAGGVIAKSLNVPHFLEINAPLAEQGQLFRNQAFQEGADYLEKIAIKNAGYLVVLTDELKTWLIKQGVDEKKIFMKPCAVDTTLFSKEGDRVPFPGKIVLGFIGSLKPWHDIKMVDQVFRVLAKDPRIHLLVVGDGPMRPIVEKLQGEFASQVTWTGAIAQEQIPPYLRSMDITLAPYPHFDLFYFSPLKIFEYMASAKPTVATNIGQIPQLIDNGKTGLLTPPNDLGQTLAAIKKLIDDPKLRKSLGDEAKKTIDHKHTWHIRAKNWLKDVEHVL